MLLDCFCQDSLLDRNKLQPQSNSIIGLLDSPMHCLLASLAPLCMGFGSATHVLCVVGIVGVLLRQR